MSDAIHLKQNIYKRLLAQAQVDNYNIDEVIEKLLDYRETTGHELREVKLNLKGALSAGQVGLWDWNFVTNDASYSDEWKKIIGYKKHEFEDKHENFMAHIHPDDMEHVGQVIETAIAEVRQSEMVEFRIRHKDGNYRWVMATGSIVPDEAGLPSRLIGSIIDITHQKQTEEALRQSEERYRKVIENLNDMCVLYSADLTIVMVNEVAVVYTGLSKSTLVGKDSSIIFPNDQTYSYETQLQKALETKQLCTGEITTNTADGDRSLIFKHIPILDDQKNLENIVSITHDITEHKQIQASEFDLMLERERGRLLGEFVQDTAHEFRTPLSTIKTNTYLMKMNGLPDKFHARTGQIDIQVSRMQRLVDTLLMMTKLESSKPLSFSEIDLYVLLKRICEDIHLEYKDNLPKLVCNIPKNLPLVYADMIYLTEAIKQVVDNAVRFTAHDGQITVSVSTDSDWHRLSISDTGVGISVDAMPNIFKTFWRKDEAHTTPGFGLGLSIAKKIISLHQGDIGVTSRIDEGTTVVISLPPSQSES